MSPRRPAPPDSQVLPERVAARLLARASELDAAAAAGAVAVSDLRAAADEAGISARAFDAALAELQEGEAVPEAAPRRHRRPRSLVLGAAFAMLLGAGVLAVTRLLVPATAVPVPADAVPAVRMVDDAILLRCLSTSDAQDLIAPHLSLEENSISMHQGSRVMRIHATPEQLRQVRAVLDSYERAGAGSPACATRPGG